MVPYRFLVERRIEPDATIGIGGPRVVLAGDTGLYSVALQSLTNVDTPYTFFQVGIPEMGVNGDVYGLPFVRFASNVRGGAEHGDAAEVDWAWLDSAVNTNGYRLASGYLMDNDADGFTGFSFTTITYPGLKEMYDHAWEALKNQLYAAFPQLARDKVLDQGSDGLAAIDPNLKLIWETYGPVPDLITKPFVPFQFHVLASATAMTRDEFVSHALAEAATLRQGIIADSKASPALLTLVADEQTFGQLYLAALEESGLLRDEDQRLPFASIPRS